MARLGRRRKKKVIYIYTLLFSLFFSSSSSFLVVRYTRRDPENFPGTKDGAPLYLSLSLLEKKKKKKKIKVKNFFPFLSFPFWVEKEKRRKRRVLNFGDAQRSSRGFNRFGKRERLARSVSFRFAERESQRKNNKTKRNQTFSNNFYTHIRRRRRRRLYPSHLDRTTNKSESSLPTATDWNSGGKFSNFSKNV